jgi:DNA-binding response OmpR family regulator
MVSGPGRELAFGVPKILIASDSAAVRDTVRSVLSSRNSEVSEVRSGAAVRDAAESEAFDLVVLDMQITNMGAVAVCFDLRLEESAGRCPHVPVLMLLDRRADVFLAHRAAAESWVLKPLDPVRLRRAINETLAGRQFHDDSYLPTTVAAP